jgi:hypothetical protein
VSDLLDIRHTLGIDHGYVSAGKGCTVRYEICVGEGWVLSLRTAAEHAFPENGSREIMYPCVDVTQTAGKPVWMLRLLNWVALFLSTLVTRFSNNNSRPQVIYEVFVSASGRLFIANVATRPSVLQPHGITRICVPAGRTTASAI